MAIKLSFGGADFTPLLEGDLATFLKDNADHVLNFDPATLQVLDRPVSALAGSTYSGSFTFDTAPTWTILQKVPINITVSAGITCTISLLKPGDTLFTYYAGPDSDTLTENPVKAADGRYYLLIDLQCSLSLGASATFSSGSLGVSGNISNDDQFDLKTGSWVIGSTTLKQALTLAFSSFVLPFQASSIQGLPDGDFIDFDFVGKLQLGFGATYGFTGLFFAGLSNGEAAASFSTPVGKTVLSAAPSYSVGASFKLTYSHNDLFRIVAARTNNASFNGVTLYLLKQDASLLQTQEGFGITVSLGAKFQTDASTLQSETQAVTTRILGSAGSLLAGKLSGAIGSAVDDVNSSVNALLATADGQNVINLQFQQSSATTNTALFVFTFDFAQSGLAGYDLAMKGDYAGAIQQAGVQVGAGSFVEQLYVRQAGFSLQLFHLPQFNDVTTFINQSQVFYQNAGRTLQIRDVIGFKSVSGIVGKDREADLYFTAQATMPSGSSSVSGVSVSLTALLVDTDNATGFRETTSFLTTLNAAPVSTAVQRYINAHPHGAISVMFKADASAFAQIPVTNYLSNGKPAPEPHVADAQNYAALVQAIKMVIGEPDQIATTFEAEFGAYADWLEFNRVKTDEEGSTNPGDRLSEGNPASSVWPENYGPADEDERLMVQAYIFAAQQGMNFFASLKQLAGATAATTDTNQFNALLRAISGLIRKEVPFPTYFLKPVLAAALQRAGLSIQVDGDIPDPISSNSFSVTLEGSRAAAVAH